MDSDFAGKAFTEDWTTHNFDSWRQLFTPRRECVFRILEIGSWEGRSAVFFLEFFSGAHITCIDTFAGNIEHYRELGLGPRIPLVERQFDENLASYGDRVTKIKSTSAVALARLIEQRAQFDLIYIDGSHMRDDVLIDSLLAWQLAGPGALLLWDDYGGAIGKPDAERPAPAIDLFLGLHSGEFTELHRGYQVAVEKVSN
jgi:predicted O-methyltransferase YrrM